MGYTDLFSLEGKVAIVPGGGGGIGSKLAAGMCEAGAEIAIIDRSGSAMKEACDLIATQGKRPLSVAADLTDRDEAGAGSRASTGRATIVRYQLVEST